MQLDRITVNNIESVIPVDCLIVLKGSLAGISVKVLKDDGCNTNIISRQFATKHASAFNIQPTRVPIAHSKQTSSKIATKVVLDATVSIGKHDYSSNFFVADCRYDGLLGMPWNR